MPTTPGDRRAPAATLRVGLTVIFGLDGALFASWASRLPEVRESVGGSGALGLALLGIALGAIPAMLITGRLCRRLRPVRVAAVTLVGLALIIAAPGHLHQPFALFGVLVAFGACYGATDVAMNTAAVDLASEMARPIVPAFHGAFSLGGLLGAAIGALAAGWRVPVPAHLTAMGVLAVAAAAVLVTRAFLGAPRPQPPPEPSAQAYGSGRRSLGIAVALGAVLTGAAAFGEGAVANWSGIHLITVGGAALWVGPLGYGVMSLTQAAGRLAGPRLIEAYGVRRVCVFGAAIATLALALALVPVPGIALIGYALAGIGLSNLFPLGIAQAGEAAGSVGVSRVATVGYGAFLLGPPLIGLLADQVGLGAALVLPVLVFLGTTAVTSKLPAR